MTSYLQRLAGRAAPAARRQLDPFVHSRSPIAEHDQRLGLPGFADGPPRFADAPTPPTIAAGVSSPTIQRLVQPTLGVVAGIGSAAPHMRGAAISSTPRSSGPGSQTTRTVTEPAGTVIAEQADRAHSASATEPGPAPSSQSFEQSRRTTTGRNDSNPFRRHRSIAPVARDPGEGSRNDVASSVDATTMLMPDQAATLGSDETETGHPTDLEVRAPYLTPALPTSSVASGSVLTVDSPALADTAITAPRLEIGSIQVEVVPPPKPREITTTRTGPLTAESVSVIGPLAARRRSNLRFGLRQR